MRTVDAAEIDEAKTEVSPAAPGPGSRLGLVCMVASFVCEDNGCPSRGKAL